MPDIDLSKLDAIRAKVRRITRSPSLAQLSNADIDAYINTFVLYDMPEHLRQFSLRKNFTFYTQPYVDVYDPAAVTDPTSPAYDITSPLYNFNNLYITLHRPVYIAGFTGFYSQDQEQFYGMYPRLANIVSVGIGDGVSVFFSGTLSSKPVLLNQVMFTSIDINNQPLLLKDAPTIPFNGTGWLVDNAGTVRGSINYLTGVWAIGPGPLGGFATPPLAGAQISAQTIPYVPSRPLSMLYFNNKFTVRPVPDRVYAIQMEVYARPTELLVATQTPELSEWWQYIAYGAARKIFQDRLDMDSLALIEPEFDLQQRLILRRTLIQYSNERTATIYTEQTSGPGGYNNIPWYF